MSEKNKTKREPLLMCVTGARGVGKSPSELTYNGYLIPEYNLDTFKSVAQGLTSNQLQSLIKIINSSLNTGWFTYTELHESTGIKKSAAICRVLTDKGFLKKKSKHVIDEYYPHKIIKFKLKRLPKLKKTKMNKNYNIEMLLLFFKANNFELVGKNAWENKEVRVKIVSNHKFLINNKDTSKKHQHLATVIIPNSDDKLYILFKEFLGLELN